MTTLSILGGLNAVLPTTWASIFDAFPILQALILESTNVGGFPGALTYALSAPIAAPPGTVQGEEGPRVRCPALEELDMYGEEWGMAR
ncbi:hypothetical protein TRAPUB_11560 [Trametes pubescens]|uniref:Uncharacterized protein n=1 Tax=Trametes pubescens TaxID=154538 RepID=A0A1M2VWC6_TRAPU|nr:hypothetical protein TRAPUB_11560 [Trametes pubescens]